MHALDFLVRIDDGCNPTASGKLVEEPASNFMKVLDATLFQSVLPSLDSQGGNFRIQIQYDCYIGHATRGSDPADAPKVIHIQSTRGALVNDVGKQKSIANNSTTGLESRPNVFCD
jgi:hypothetical protein